MITYLVRFAVTLVLLLYASVCDVVTREVADQVWLIGVPACLLLDCIDLSLGTLDLLSLALSMGTAFLIGFVLCFLGFYGGADGKALLLLAAAMPAYLSGTNMVIVTMLPLPILLVVFCSILLSVLYPLTILLLNAFDYVRGKRLLQDIDVENPLKRLLLYSVTRRVNIEDLKGHLNYFPAETIVVEDGTIRRKPIYFLHAEADIDGFIETLEKHKGLFDDGVLTSPTIPMIVFLTIGFLFSNLLLFWT